MVEVVVVVEVGGGVLALKEGKYLLFLGTVFPKGVESVFIPYALPSLLSQQYLQ